MITNVISLSPHKTAQCAPPWMWGPEVTPSGVLYRLPCCGAGRPVIEVLAAEGTRVVPMKQVDEGCWSATDSQGRGGDRYFIRLSKDLRIPDPASRFQPEGVHGPSQVIDRERFHWTDQEWRRPPFRDLVIYELHIGTFTQEGTFLSAIKKLGYLRELGVNAIELMPVSAFPGQRNWGYDGAYLFAPAAAYGTPDDLRSLVNAAHAEGIAVIVDVVYNHFGPDGSFICTAYSKFFHPRHQTPWGNGINYDAEGSGPVRKFVLENVCHWLGDFHIDGLRLDATHTICDDSAKHILTEITETIHAQGGYAIAEEPRNLAKFTESRSVGGHGFDAVWADEFHHVARIGQTHESIAFYRDFLGTSAELCETLQNGWLYRGRYSPHLRADRGTSCRHLPPSAFIHFISTHDHAGNHALGKRLNHFVSPEAYRALSLLICLSPYTPMLFMGQEWATDAPFLFFTDHNEEIGEQVRKGRQDEFAGCPGFEDEAALAKIPNPQTEQTFLDSKIRWHELKKEPFAKFYELYRAGLALRQQHRCFRPQGREGWSVAELKMGGVGIRFEDANEAFLLLLNLWDGRGGELGREPIASLAADREWKLVLAANDVAFGGEARTEFDVGRQTVRFEGADAILLRSSH